MAKNFNPIIYVEDDKLTIPKVHIWSLEKYKLVGGYCDMFTKTMINKWNNLIYLDLYSGSGYSQIEENNKIVRSSPLISMSIPTKFTKYIFCDEDNGLIEPLNKRIKRDFNELDYSIIPGDCNQKIEEIKNEIPKFYKGNTVLSFCFVDPFDLDICFSTIQALGENLVDFLILQALHMDAKRNIKHYVDERNNKISNYLGDENWRDKLPKGNLSPGDFVKFLADQYDENMKGIGYLEAYRHPIKIPDKNVPLYYLTFYSKHKTGQDFFNKVDEYSTPQITLDL